MWIHFVSIAVDKWFLARRDVRGEIYVSTINGLMLVRQNYVKEICEIR